MANMPRPNGQLWRRARARLDLTSGEAGRLLRVTGGALRMIETEGRPASLTLGGRASKLYGVPVEFLFYGSIRPALTAGKSDWVVYAIAQGADPSVAEAASKAELIDHYGSADERPKPDPEPKPPEPKVEPTSPPPRRNGKDNNKRRPPRSADLRGVA